MNDKEWLESELKRTGMSLGALSRESRVFYPTIHRVFSGENDTFTPLSKERIKRVFTSTPDAPHRDYEGIRNRLRATGLGASMIRTCSGVARDAIIRFMGGGIPKPSVFDRLAAWCEAGCPPAPRMERAEPSENKSPSLRGNIARTLAIIEGRAGVCPETSLGAGYQTSSTLATSVEIHMPARTRFNKYVQI